MGARDTCGSRFPIGAMVGEVSRGVGFGFVSWVVITWQTRQLKIHI